MSFECFQYNIEILVHKDVIEELAPFLEEVEISLRVLHAVLDVAFGVPPAAAQAVQVALSAVELFPQYKDGYLETAHAYLVINDYVFAAIARKIC